jgi:hypothetical protein
MNELQISKCLIVVPMCNIFLMLFSQLTNSHINEKDGNYGPQIAIFFVFRWNKF